MKPTLPLPQVCRPSIVRRERMGELTQAQRHAAGLRALRLSRWVGRSAAAALASGSTLALAQGFTKINTTVTNVNAILVTISIAVVTMAIIWAGFKMIFSGARLADVANVLIGGTLVGGAAAFAAFIVS
jgi:type IV secretion system protein VirB2